MYDELRDKHVLITGASRGIGLRLTKAFAQSGASVLAISRHARAPELHELSKYPWGYAITHFSVDIRDPQELETSIEEYVKQFEHIDILVNNAGVVHNDFIQDIDQDDWDDVIETNLNATYRSMHTVIPLMRKVEWGRIINIISVLASTGIAGASSYSASKAAIAALTKSAAIENAKKNITCNCVAYGYMGTGMCDRLSEKRKLQTLAMTPMKRFGTEQETVAPVLFLASDGASFITGQTLHVNGGLY